MKVSTKFIKKLQDCDKKAFELLYNEYAGLIKAIAYRYVKNWEQAEDILQETFVTIYRKIHQYSGKGSFEGWLKRIAINNALQFLKEKQKQYFDDVNEIQIAQAEDNTEVNEKDMESLIKSVEFSQEEILEVVASLPTGFRLVFSMYVLENYKHREIAELLEISESTSKTQLLRARKLLQKKLYEIAKLKNQQTKEVFLKEAIGRRAKR
jgi:RNA polymerase sigma-70 factor (ECF subfamily)